MKKVSITHLTNAHNTWLRSLDFYKEEIGILKGILTEVADKNSGTEVMKEVEHYENQFKLQINNIDNLVHEVKQNLSNASKEAQEASAGYIHGEIQAQHEVLAGQVATEEKIINELRHSFQQFAAEWM